MYSEVIPSSVKRIAAVFNSLRNNGLLSYQADNPWGVSAWESGQTGHWNLGRELVSKSCCYFSVAGEGFGRKGDGLIGRGFGMFASKGFDYSSQAWMVTYISGSMIKRFVSNSIYWSLWCCGRLVRSVRAYVGQCGKRSGERLVRRWVVGWFQWGLVSC